jgi:NAD(P)-dependent dehydrogenase (short-subunit alcohol dehydrogenase family)
LLEVNVGGVVNGLRAFVPRMLAAEGPGGILVTASLAGLLTWPGGGPYGASKHAAVAVAEAAALALEGTQICVTALCPAPGGPGRGPADGGSGPRVMVGVGEEGHWHPSDQQTQCR